MRCLCVFCLCFALTAEATSSYELAEHYSPVLYQGIGHHPRADFIATFDYDGDDSSANNWENLEQGTLEAALYYSVIESETHWFLTYLVFHPRDYSRVCLPVVCHENDLEGIKITVAKDGSEFGSLRLMETIAHFEILAYAAPTGSAKSRVGFKGSILLETGHPVVFVEAQGHGIYGMDAKRQAACRGTCLVYRQARGEAVEPSWPADRSAGYELRPIYDALWQVLVEQETGTFANFFTFVNPLSGATKVLPGSLSGDNWGKDKANLPWAWVYPRDSLLARGDWFLDPAKNLAVHFDLDEPVSRIYTDNSFLESI
ncbi:MAG: hypothetical protein A2284_16870 [Deltaproteobacteria bacterium RIFOXYA12_FULL_61_11]|nr:MAG: hypothetical protein A2284_16870 [Deltaproteobacteria bacterium RIFOXYA12_FULL_61_11]